jgi:hypothetical protein
MHFGLFWVYSNKTSSLLAQPGVALPDLRYDCLSGSLARAQDERILEFRPPCSFVPPGCIGTDVGVIMHATQAVAAHPQTDLGGAQSLLVRKLVFSCVYYNNGNSLGFFSIPTIAGSTIGLGEHSFSFIHNGKTELSISNFAVGVSCTLLAQCRSSSVHTGWAPASSKSLFHTLRSTTSRRPAETGRAKPEPGGWPN